MRTQSTLLSVLFCAVLACSAEEAEPAASAVRLRIALVNLKAVYSDGPDEQANAVNIQNNLKRHLHYIDVAAGKGAEFIGFPELSINGYRFSDKMTWLTLEGPEVKALRDKAVEKRIYVSAGLAEVDANGKRWNTHIVIDPKGEIIGKHHKIWLTKEKPFVEAGAEHNVFDVKGTKMGMLICADGSDPKNLEKLAENGAKIIYAPHANTTGGTISGWYKFRANWGGGNGLIAKLKVFAALHNNAGLYDPQQKPPVEKDTNSGWASGAWFIGPDGKTLAQMPASESRAESKEFVLIHDVPIKK